MDDGERGFEGENVPHNQSAGGAMEDAPQPLPPNGNGHASGNGRDTNSPGANGKIYHLPVQPSLGGPMKASDLHGLPSGDIGKPGFSVLARLCGALRAFDPESTGMRIPLADLEDEDIRKIDGLLGRDGVGIDAAGDPIRKGYATRIAGVWRAHIETPDGESLFEWLEIGDIPSFVRDLAKMGAGNRLNGSNGHHSPAIADSTNGNGGAVNGSGDESSTVTAFIHKIVSAAKLFRNGQHNTSFALDGLGNPAGSPAAARAAAELRARLGQGPVCLTSDSRAIRAHATNYTNVWVIEHLPNGRPPEAKGTFQIEVGDVPSAMRSAPEDIEHSAIRFATVLERIVLGAPLSTVKL